MGEIVHKELAIRFKKDVMQVVLLGKKYCSLKSKTLRMKARGSMKKLGRTIQEPAIRVTDDKNNGSYQRICIKSSINIDLKPVGVRGFKWEYLDTE